MNRRIVSPLIPLLLGAAVLACSAGTIITYICGNADCRLGGEFHAGGSARIRPIAEGYCTSCGKFVKVLPKTNSSDHPTEPVGSVWIPGEEQQRKLYRCPDCRAIFAEIDFLTCSQGKMPCPKCGTNTPVFVMGSTGDWD